MKINWEKYVDHIYSIHYYTSNIFYDNYIKELKRVDILSSKIYEEFIGISSPLIDMLSNQFINVSKVNISDSDYKKYFNLFFNDYVIIKQAYLLGYEKILILEDDGIFLKNKEDIIEILDKTIDIFKTHESCIFLGSLNIHVPKFRNDYDKGIDYTNNIYTYNHKKYWSGGAGFNIYNRGAMKQYIDFVESRLFAIPDQYSILYDENTYVIFSLKNVCIQNPWILFIKNCDKYYNLYKPTIQEYINYVKTTETFSYNNLNENEKTEILNNFFDIFNYTKEEKEKIYKIYIKRNNE